MGNTVNRSHDRNTTLDEDISENNGLLFMDKFIPEEIFFRIFSFLPAKELLCTVSRVCHNWNNILHQNSFWFCRLKYDNISLSSKFRLELLNHMNKKDVLQCLQNMSVNQPYNRNLIRNPSGQDGLQFWNIKRGGDGVIVEKIPSGSDPIPEEAGLPSQHCFVTSYMECLRFQEVKLQSLGVSPWVMNVLKPRITASEWVSARWDCDSWTELNLLLLKNTEVIATKSVRWSSMDDGIVNKKWYKIQVDLSDYPDGVTSIRYMSCGKDHQFWKGHYGTKSAGSALHLQLCPHSEKS